MKRRDIQTLKPKRKEKKKRVVRIQSLKVKEKNEYIAKDRKLWEKNGVTKSAKLNLKEMKWKTGIPTVSGVPRSPIQVLTKPNTA